jgi:hypothetical protein
LSIRSIIFKGDANNANISSRAEYLVIRLVRINLLFKISDVMIEYFIDFIKEALKEEF